LAVFFVYENNLANTVRVSNSNSTSIFAEKLVMYFSKTDEIELNRRGLNIHDLMQMIQQFTKDTKPVKLERPCTQADGILVPNGGECHRLQKVFEAESSKYSIVKFVPASGAASRMFKHLYNYSTESISELTEEFIVNLKHFPFISELSKTMERDGLTLEEAADNNNWGLIFDYILTTKGLFYDASLKGMVIFHRYQNETRNAFDEHIFEAISYCRMSDGSCHLHFTIAPQHLDMVSEYITNKLRDFPYENIVVNYSIQSEKSDTVALNKDNEPVRDENGQLFFRPAGHGALIHNLESLPYDIVFIKNIDNVTTQSKLEECSFYKQVLAGLLIELKQKINYYLDALPTAGDELLDESMEFIQAWFQPGLPLGMPREQLIHYAQLRLDRPLRVCGMVRNEGEPGGGPFWVKMTGGYLSKQIVEKSQVDLHDVQQAKILATSTHFNPVDIVCSIRKGNGENYKLSDFIDYSAGFVSEKFYQGQVIKALEWPGLWNGSMALWNTVFVEVPTSTFNPVKTVNDLLRPGHQEV
jgi:hypothetical protein